MVESSNEKGEAVILVLEGNTDFTDEDGSTRIIRNQHIKPVKICYFRGICVLIKPASTDQHGWCEPEYTISENLSFSVESVF